MNLLRAVESGSFKDMGLLGHFNSPGRNLSKRTLSVSKAKKVNPAKGCKLTFWVSGTSHCGFGVTSPFYGFHPADLTMCSKWMNQLQHPSSPEQRKRFINQQVIVQLA